MVEENFYDLVVDELHEMRDLVRAEFRSQFKKTKPFRKEPISNDELLYEYSTKGYEVFEEIANTQGLEMAIDYRNKMETLKQKRGVG